MMGILNSLLKRKKEAETARKDSDIALPPPPPPALSKVMQQTPELPKLKSFKKFIKKQAPLKLQKFEKEEKSIKEEEKEAIISLLEKPSKLKKKEKDLVKKERGLKTREEAYKRDLDYLETLRRVHDNELRERERILKQIETELNNRENELNERETALLKEERIMHGKKQISEIKIRHTKLNELEKLLKKKEDEILKQEQLFNQKTIDFEKSVLASRDGIEKRSEELLDLEKANAKKALVLKQFQEQIARSKEQLQNILVEQKERLKRLSDAWVDKEKKLNAVAKLMGVVDFPDQIKKIRDDMAELEKKDEEIVTTVRKITSERQMIDKKEFETNQKLAYMEKMQRKLEYERLNLAKEKEQLGKDKEKIARIKELKEKLPSLEEMHQKLMGKINEEQRKLDQIMLQSVATREMLKDKEKEINKKEVAMEKEFMLLKNKEQRYAEEVEEIEEKEFNEFVDAAKQKLSPIGIKSVEYFERRPKKIEAEPSKFDALIKNCHDSIGAGQLIAAKQFYNQLREQFYGLKLEERERKVLLNTIRELYDDINLAMLR